MKFYSILLLTLLICIYTVEEKQQSDLKCKSSEPPYPSSAKDCNKRKVDPDNYCCYIKGEVHDGYYIKDVNGCLPIEKKNIDNNNITSTMEKLKLEGFEGSLDCISSYLSISLLLLLFIFI